MLPILKQSLLLAGFLAMFTACTSAVDVRAEGDGDASKGAGGSHAGGSGGGSAAGASGTGGASGAGGHTTGGAAGGAGSEVPGDASPDGTGGSSPEGDVCTPGSGTEDVGTASVRDRATCLTWQKAASGKMTNKQALQYCDELSQDSYDDWRVPTPQELVTWPNLAVSGDAYITGPTYIPASSPSEQEGCTGNSHSCNISEYSEGNLACAWQGVAFAGPAVCVRGVAAVGSLSDKYAAEKCGACAAEAGSSFKEANCLPYAP
jgi:hypothetical protein